MGYRRLSSRFSTLLFAALAAALAAGCTPASQPAGPALPLVAEPEPVVEAAEPDEDREEVPAEPPPKVVEQPSQVEEVDDVEPTMPPAALVEEPAPEMERQGGHSLSLSAAQAAPKPPAARKLPEAEPAARTAVEPSKTEAIALLEPQGAMERPYGNPAFDLDMLGRETTYPANGLANFVSAGGRFKMFFPRRPAQELKSGRGLEGEVYKVEQEEKEFFAGYFVHDYKGMHKLILNRAINKVRKRVSGRLIHSTPITYMGYHGQEFLIAAGGDGMEGKYVAGRYYSIGNTMYFTRFTGWEKDVQGSAAQSFLSSFQRVLPGEEPPLRREGPERGQAARGVAG